MREEEKKSSQDTSMKRFFKKRWAYPAIYLASAAIILSGVVWYQNSGTESDKFDYEATDQPGKKLNDAPAVEVNRALENFLMPAADPEKVVIQKQFYDNDSKKEEQEAALVVYNNQYHPNTGIDIAHKNGKEFEVVASVSGTVKSIKDDALLGNVIEIEHDKGIVTQYQSVKNIKVKAGQKVDQGQALATSGRSMFNEKAGIHVHFEIRKDNIPVNPSDFFEKPMSALMEANVVPADNSGKTEETSDDSKMEDGTKSGDSTKPEDGTKSGEGTKPEGGTKSDEGGKPEDGTKSDEGAKPEDGTKSEEDAKPEDSTKSKDGTKLNEESSKDEGTKNTKESEKDSINPSSESKNTTNS
ncbi:peptidoglycan DD-metalloendopeptidase family protein [Mesobacillus zeae]|uniref:M23 family peptidase n=1 Tax=Mesobacillus zeae TaxID=1917180 RepID=A0A398B0X8_9BACI|nr:peptidoglycan DD-metalloendopeptidase family protein [Mesobacillus zeae]RID83465.1 M23 family peptidase [Mesobacillus zeae]